MRFLSKKTLTVILALLCVPVLSGCIKAEEAIWLNPDGSGRIELVIGVSEQLLALSEDTSGGVEEIFSGELLGLGGNEGSQNPYIKDLESKKYNQDDFKYLAVSSDLTDVEKAFAHGGGNEFLSLTRLENGNMLLKQTFSPNSETEIPSDETSQQMMKTMLTGYYWHMLVHVEGVANTNGVVDKDAGTVEWNVPILDLVTAAEPYEITLEYKPPARIPAAFPVAGGSVVLLALIALFVLFLRSRRSAATATALPADGAYTN